MPEDAAGMWRLAGTSGLDRNSPYYYLAFCRDFAATSVVVPGASGPRGFVTGYRRPEQPATLFVWQVAVDPGARRRGLGLAMLCELRDRLVPEGMTHLEATVTPSNDGSRALFGSFAECSSAAIASSTEFEAGLFPADAGHEPEVLVRIGPLPAEEG